MSSPKTGETSSFRSFKKRELNIQEVKYIFLERCCVMRTNLCKGLKLKSRMKFIKNFPWQYFVVVYEKPNSDVFFFLVKIQSQSKKRNRMETF